MRPLTVCSLFLSILLHALPCPAVNWYVNKAAGSTVHNGRNWNTAWTEMDLIDWASIRAGDTIWLAGGTYRTQIIPKTRAATAKRRIYIKRALSTDSIPTATAGWRPVYDSQVVIDVDRAILWDRGYGFTPRDGSYITVDGRVPSGIKTISPCDHWYSAGVYMDVENTGVTLQNIEFAGPGGPDEYPYIEDGSGIQTLVRPGGGNSIYSLNVNHCSVHGFPNMILCGLTDSLIEHNKLYDNRSTYGTSCINTDPNKHCHDNIVYSAGSPSVTFRNNEIYNFDDEGILIASNLGEIWKIYGNVWHSPVGTARVVETQGGPHTVYLYNNTICDLWMTSYVPAEAGGSWTAASRSRNNICWNTPLPALGNDDYNFSNGDNPERHGIANGKNPFRNYAAKNFHIKGTIGADYPANKGSAMGAQFGTDPDGRKRGLDGAWDIGAYEAGPGVLQNPALDLLLSQ